MTPVAHVTDIFSKGRVIRGNKAAFTQRREYLCRRCGKSFRKAEAAEPLAHISRTKPMRSIKKQHQTVLVTDFLKRIDIAGVAIGMHPQNSNSVFRDRRFDRLRAKRQRCAVDIGKNRR